MTNADRMKRARWAAAQLRRLARVLPASPEAARYLTAARAFDAIVNDAAKRERRGWCK